MEQMMGNMNPEEKEKMMSNMMEKFIEGMTSEEKQRIMEKMMSKMMDNMNMSEMMPFMMSRMMGGMMGGKKEGGHLNMADIKKQADFKPWEFCPCRNFCESGFEKKSGSRK